VSAAGVTQPADGLSLSPLRALRPRADGPALGRLLCPPYDVIDADARSRLLAEDPDNAVAVILPEPTPAGYAAAAERLESWIRDQRYAVDETPSLFVYEMREDAGQPTRGLVGALELRAPEDGVVLPHENTMAGPVADRLEVMTGTGTDLEPIYLVYDGGGPASDIVRSVSDRPPLAQAGTPDGVEHRLWALTDAGEHARIAADLATRRALIADGHHRYATYRERQRQRRAAEGPGPWDRGLTLLVDSSEYGPQVHAIHRVVTGMTLDAAVEQVSPDGAVQRTDSSATDALDAITHIRGFAAVLADGAQTYIVTDPQDRLAGAANRSGEPAALAKLDVTILHRGLVEHAWGRPDDVDHLKYAHTVDEALRDANAHGGFAVLVRPTPVAAVTAVAAAGARMPRKSTLFTPKPASGLVMRRLTDQRGLPD
jgi:uncharacterized protein (DUF1015 family)